MGRTNDALKRFWEEKGEIKNLGKVLEITETQNRSLILGDIDEETGESVEQMIRFFNRADNEDNIPADKRQPIKIYINSGGGSLNATLMMIDAIKMSKTPVYTITTGAAYSGGFFTSICGHKRFGYKNSSYLYHEGSCVMGGDAHKFRNQAKFYEGQLLLLKDITLSNTKISEEEYDKHIKDDWWFTAEEALAYGIIDEISEEII